MEQDMAAAAEALSSWASDTEEEEEEEEDTEGSDMGIYDAGAITDLLKDEGISTAEFFEALSDKEPDFDQASDAEMKELVEAMLARLARAEEDHAATKLEKVKVLHRLLLILPWGGLGDSFAKHLAHTTFPSVLTIAMMELTELTLEDDEDSTRYQDVLVLIYQTIRALCNAQWFGRDENATPPRYTYIYGRDVIGPMVLEPILEQITFTSCLSVAVRRAASSALLSMITKSKKNQADLLSFDLLCKDLFHEHLAACGDFSTQLEIVEVLFRCAKSGHADAIFHFVRSAQVRAMLHRAMAKGPVDLNEELQPIVRAFNSSLERPTVHSFETGSVSFNFPGMLPTNPWIDVGSTHLTLHFKFYYEDSFPDDDEEAEQSVDFDFGKFKAKAKDDKEQDHIAIKLIRDVCPPELTYLQEQHTEESGRENPKLRATIRVHKDVAASLLRLLPQESIHMESKAPELHEFLRPSRHAALCTVMLWICMARAQLRNGIAQPVG